MGFGTKGVYSQVPHEQEEDVVSDSVPHIKSRDRQPSRLSRIASNLLYLIAALIGSAITVTILTAASPRQAPSVDAGCGHSVEEALANGCKFDTYASTWEHPECQDQELLDETLQKWPLTWFRDQNHTQPVSIEEIARGEFQEYYLYPMPDYHTAHCMYQWKKQHRAFLAGRAISEDLWRYKHSMHCAKVIQEPWPEWTSTLAGFSKCRSPDVWRKHELAKDDEE